MDALQDDLTIEELHERGDLPARAFRLCSSLGINFLSEVLVLYNNNVPFTYLGNRSEVAAEELTLCCEKYVDKPLKFNTDVLTRNIAVELADMDSNEIANLNLHFHRQIATLSPKGMGVVNRLEIINLDGLLRTMLASGFNLGLVRYASSVGVAELKKVRLETIRYINQLKIRRQKIAANIKDKVASHPVPAKNVDLSDFNTLPAVKCIEEFGYTIYDAELSHYADHVLHEEDFLKFIAKYVQANWSTIQADWEFRKVSQDWRISFAIKLTKY